MMPQLIHNETEHQFEFHMEGKVAFVEYFTEGQKIYLTHTEVPKSLRANGIATELIQQTLGYIKKQHWTLIPQCSFVSAYVNNHPEWHSILSEGYQM